MSRDLDSAASLYVISPQVHTSGRRLLMCVCMCIFMRSLVGSVAGA